MSNGSSSEKISEALNLLEDAAKQKKHELQGLLKDKYEALKGTVMETEEVVADKLRAAKARAKDAAGYATEYSLEKAKEVDELVHKNPWPYVGGAAVAALLLGFILGRKEK